MAKITYILGAGASYDALPTVNDFEKEIEAILRRLNIHRNAIRIYAPKGSHDEYRTILDVAIGDLQLLLKGCSNHRSVDTYAKMLYLTSDKTERAEHYRKAKSSVVLFFELYKFYRNKIDKRYDAFLATILKREVPRLPESINILSWNYDYELERAYMNYSPDKTDIHQVYEDLNIIHKNSSQKKSVLNNFSVIKINGTAGFYTADKKLILGLNHSAIFPAGAKQEDITYVFPLLKNYYDYTKDANTGYSPAISFSWEEDYGETKILNEISNALADTQHVVVIGYSFPYFNRDIDSKIFNSKRTHRIRKVFVQDPQAGGIIESLNDLRSDWSISSGVQTNFHPKTNLDQFYMAF